MNTYGSNAIIVGLLFLIALVFNLIASGISDPSLTAPDYLAQIYPNKTPVIIACLLNLICAVAMIFIPIVLFQVARKFNERLALAYIVFRFLEGILFTCLAIKTLTLVSLSKAYLSAEGQSALWVQTLGDAVQAEIHWAMLVYIATFTLGALTFYPLLFQSRLLPRFLSVWGMLAAGVMGVAVILGIFSLGIFEHMPLMQAMVYFAPPIALNELVLSLWLITKGFSLAALIREPAD